MFTGIIETVGRVLEVKENGTNLDFVIGSDISAELKIDQSVSHNGVCLTVTDLHEDTHTVTAIQETLNRSNLKDISPGDKLNLERCMKANGRFDGHIVQGHVDQVGQVHEIEAIEGSWIFTFVFSDTDEVLVDKGSITVNGVSLTCFDTTDHCFKVAIIPFTYQNTCFQDLKTGDRVNLEFDIVGKYVQRLLGRKSSQHQR